MENDGLVLLMRYLKLVGLNIKTDGLGLSSHFLNMLLECVE